MPIESAPKDGTKVLLWCGGRWSGVEIGSFRTDLFDEDGEALWLLNDYNDFSVGYASTPLEPTHWQPLPEPPADDRWELTEAGRAMRGGK